ncbi:MAG: lasso RiPP family leader peptide-containing protein [Egibacteraceae bacterium]
MDVEIEELQGYEPPMLVEAGTFAELTRDCGGAQPEFSIFMQNC